MVIITIGYSATFLAGFLAIIYVVRGVFTPSLGKEIGASLARMIYGIVCFATLFSFVGTVLGGIWADQSWGRFWGWDSKENGALMIVVWNAIILHCRWGGFVKDRGLVVLALVGNIVHRLVLVWREHAGHRPAQLRLYGQRVPYPEMVCRDADPTDDGRVSANDALGEWREPSQDP